MEKMNVSSERNITLIMDFYELTMSYNYFKMGKGEQIVYFDMFYRKNPDNGGFVIFAGLQQLIEAIQDMHFSEGDIEYLRSLHIFDEDFFDYLRNFKFTGTIYAVKEGTPVFPYEPLVTVKAKLIEDVYKRQLDQTRCIINPGRYKQLSECNQCKETAYPNLSYGSWKQMQG